MNFEEIRDAALSKKRFTLTNVTIAELGVCENKVNIKFLLPQINGAMYAADKDYTDIQVCDKPKYDPCRPFRVGDIVTPIERDGREVPDGAPVGEKCTVVESEKNGIVCIRYDAGSEHYIHEIPYFHLELVTPVEELKSFYLESDELFFFIYFGTKRNYELVARLDKKYYTLTEAYAEHDRLNAEYRKEQNNV